MEERSRVLPVMAETDVLVVWNLSGIFRRLRHGGYSYHPEVFSDPIRNHTPTESGEPSAHRALHRKRRLVDICKRKHQTKKGGK